MAGGRFDPFEGTGPRWRAVPAWRPFLEDLAAGVLDWLGDQTPETLTDATILLPNRRAARAFSSALGKLAGDRPVLLPQVRPLGDLEEDEPPFAPGELGLDLPPAIPALMRRFEMARMIAEDFEPGMKPLRALEMADALGGFLDSCQLEEVQDLDRIASLAEQDLAAHWQESARFLGLAVEAWPRRLEALGLVDSAWRRATLLRRLAEAWDARPPQQPVIAAGSTGTVPAAADVLAAVARAPQGVVVLPGLDLDLADTVWDRIEDQHPQAALKYLLTRAGVSRDQVTPWFRPTVEPHLEARGLARQRLINEALRPAEATDDWRTEIAHLRAEAARAGRAADPIAEGLEGLSVQSVRAEEEAASAIALLMRQTLEVPGQTCALVTPDLDLSRRVEARMARWGIVADSSTGTPLSRMSAGVMVDLCARFIEDPLKPQTLLGLIKHPLTRLEIEGTDLKDAAAVLEQYGLRGPRPRRWSDLHKRLLRAEEPRRGGQPLGDWQRERLAGARHLAERLETLATTALAAFHPTTNPGTAAGALATLIEALAGQNAWAGPDGEAAASLLSGLIEGGASLGEVTRADFAALTHSLLSEETVRTGGATHPRLRILGAIEARLTRADRMILAGLEEGVWPRPAPVDPFLSRPMRKLLGLPTPEKRLGQTAQDFVQAACADEAILIHCERRGGQPAVRSRWLWRLEMLTRGANAPDTPVAIPAPEGLNDWARALDAPPPGPARLAPRPAPRPPVERRPRSLYVTAVERWVRDPYALYAQRILNLEKMDRPGASAEAMARGNAVHKAIERMTAEWPYELPDDCTQRFEAVLIEELTAHGFEDAAMAREIPLARNSARWLTGFETTRRARGVTLLIEQQGEMSFNGPAGAFTVKAYADRIEVGANAAAIMDFKTGGIPTGKQMKAGFAPQLTLTAAILAEGGFKDTGGPVPADELTYVRVVGRKVPGEVAIRATGPEAAALGEAALEGLKKRVARFDDPATPYVSWAAPQFMGNFGGNYDHLARVWEWFVVGGEEGDSSE